MKIEEIFLIILSLSVFSCQYVIKIDFDYDTFNTQKKLWEENNIKDYQYEVVVETDGLIKDTKIDVFIENGGLKNYSNIEIELIINYYAEFYDGNKICLNIDDIYKIIESEYIKYQLKRIRNGHYLSSIKIEYDEDLHIPIEIIRNYQQFRSITADVPSYKKIKINNFAVN